MLTFSKIVTFVLNRNNNITYEVCWISNAIIYYKHKNNNVNTIRKYKEMCLILFLIATYQMLIIINGNFKSLDFI